MADSDLEKLVAEQGMLIKKLKSQLAPSNELDTSDNSKSMPCEHHRCSTGHYGLENYCDHPDAWEW
jgi:hypothetical protein